MRVTIALLNAVVAVDTSVKIRAEDGRAVTNTDISGFINNLPGGKLTTAFSTPDASGSTSQAANIVEVSGHRYRKEMLCLWTHRAGN